MEVEGWDGGLYMMRNIKLTIEYDGTNYHGWQVQANAKTIQAVVKSAVEKLTGGHCNLIGSGRTDTGVHALGQTANFFTQSTIPADRFSYALNSILPNDIIIKKSEEVQKDFHARFSAKGKKYRYLINNSAMPSALLRNRAFHTSNNLDLDTMKEASVFFLGTHDFKAFRASGSAVDNSVRIMTEVTLEEKKSDIFTSMKDGVDTRLIEFEIAGDGFLYNMVRIIAGTLVDVGTGRISAQSIPDIIKSGERDRAGKTAPAHGLYLVEVYY